MKQEDLLKKLKEHQSIVVNYGKGFIFDSDIKEKAIWDEGINAYRSNTGIWSTKLLLEIAQGKIDGMKLELEA